MAQPNGPPEPSMYPSFTQPAPQMQQPPQYQPPPAGFVPVQPAIVMGAPALGQDPVQMTCPACQNMIITEINPTPGLLSWLLCGGLCLIGCWFGCCLIPMCVDSCQDTEHRCPQCKHFLGTYRKM